VAARAEAGGGTTVGTLLHLGVGLILHTCYQNVSGGKLFLILPMSNPMPVAAAR